MLMMKNQKKSVPMNVITITVGAGILEAAAIDAVNASIRNYLNIRFLCSDNSGKMKS